MSAEMVHLVENLVLASGMVAVTVLVHFWGFILLTNLMQRSGKRLRPHEHRVGQAALILLVVFGIFGLHTIEIWLYAWVYLILGEAHFLEEALYFSTVTFASLGFGDIVLSPRWRLLSAIEAANGVILFAWSTTFLLGVNSRLRLLEHDWLERGNKDEPGDV
jgi:Ion channel